MQETQTMGTPTSPPSGPFVSTQCLTALLALAGARRLRTEELRARMRLSASGFGTLLAWLQKEYLVDIVSNLEGHEVRDSVILTDEGGRVLLDLLEQTCELPELH